MRAASVCLAVALGASSATAGPPSPLEVSGAWSPATGGTGADVPLYLTIANRGEADDLLRVRCPDAAHFSEKRATDLGEGTPAARGVKAIPVPAGGSVTLAPGGYHVMLLQTTRRLGQGETFSCSLVFRLPGVPQRRPPRRRGDGRRLGRGTRAAVTLPRRKVAIDA